MGKIKFEVSVSTNKVGSKCTDTLEVDKEDLEGIAEADIDDFVWEECGGKELAFNMCELNIKRIL